MIPSRTTELDTEYSTLPSHRIVLAAVLAIGVGLRLWHIDWGLPEVYEEAYPHSVAWKMWTWGRDGIDLNPHFFNYPALTFYLNFVVQALQYVVGYATGGYTNLQSFQQAYETNPTMFIILARMVSVLFDVGTISIIYLIGKEFGDRRTGLLAAVLVAINPLHVKLAHLISVDTALVFFTLLTLLFCVRLYTSPTWKWYILTGISIGLAAASKYTGTLLLIVLLAIHLLRSSTVPDAIRSLRNSRLLAAFGLAAATFVICNPYILLSFKEFYKDFSFEESHMAGGHLGVDPTVSTWGFYMLQSLPEQVGWLLLLIAVASIVWFVIGRKRSRLMLILFLFVYFAAIGSWEMRADRYLLPIVPVLLLIASIGILEWVEALHGFMKNGMSRVSRRIVVLVMLCALVGFQPIGATFTYHQSFALPDTRNVVKAWIEQHLPPKSAIATVPVGISFSKNAAFDVLTIPFFPTEPERVIPYFDTRWYEDFDLLIGSDFDYARYLQDTVRYSAFINYYRSLSRTWNLLFAVQPMENQTGPTIWLFTPPATTRRATFDEELFQQFTGSTDSLRISGFLKMMSNILVKKRKLEKAEQINRVIVSLEITNPSAYKAHAAILYDLGRFDEALTATRMYLRLKPNQADMLAFEGMVLIQLNRLDDAEASLRKALAVDRTLEVAYDHLMMIYLQRKDRAKAIDLLTQQLKVLPPNSKKAQLLAIDLQRLKQTAE